MTKCVHWSNGIQYHGYIDGEFRYSVKGGTGPYWVTLCHHCREIMATTPAQPLVGSR